MSLKDIIGRYGYKGSKKSWFSVEVKDPTIEDVKRIVAKGKLEEMGFRIPLELREYMDISPEGELIQLKEIPEELKGGAEELRAVWARIHNKNDLTEYGRR